MARVTPRVMPDGKVLLRVEAQVTTAAGAKGNTVQSVETTETVPEGGTVVVRGVKSKAAGSDAHELLIVLTVHRVATQPR
jgi:type II secretory pathway component GspD/PulD (secretin)